MVEQPRGLGEMTDNLAASYASLFTEHCKKLLAVVVNKSVVSTEYQLIPNSFRQLLFKYNLTLNSFTSVADCTAIFQRLANDTNETEVIIDPDPLIYSPRHSNSLLTFVILIACVSFISILGNLCLAKVLYSKRHRLIQTDRIVLCLALSKRMATESNSKLIFALFR